MTSNITLKNNGTICLNFYSANWTKLKGNVAIVKVSDGSIAHELLLKKGNMKNSLRNKIFNAGAYVIKVTNITGTVKLLDCVDFDGIFNNYCKTMFDVNFSVLLYDR
jgi:hypothetical protein